MSKICEYKGCETEIMEWQELCPKHYSFMMQQQQPQQQQQARQQPSPPDMLPEMKVEETKRQPLPRVEERERLIMKQTSLKCAVDFMKSLDNEGKEFEQLMEEVRTMTANFYRMIVEKNEELV